MQRMGFVMQKAMKTAKKLPPNSEELNESYALFDGGGEQHSSLFDSQLGTDRRANGARQRERLDHENFRCAKQVFVTGLSDKRDTAINVHFEIGLDLYTDDFVLLKKYHSEASIGQMTPMLNG